MSEEKEGVKNCPYCGITILRQYEFCQHPTECSLRQKINSLESRLKEANKIIESFHAQNITMQERLSQAEAEVKRQCELAEFTASGAAELLMDENKDLKARLSHLMDVAGKMAGALELVLKRGTQVQNSDQFMFEVIKGTELALAEWDGIKKEGGK